MIDVLKECVIIKSNTLERFMEMLVFETLIKLDLKRHQHSIPIRSFEKMFIRKIILDMESFLRNGDIPKKNGRMEEDQLRKMRNQLQSLNPRLRKVIIKNEHSRLKESKSLEQLVEQKLQEKKKKKLESPTGDEMLESKYNLQLEPEKGSNEFNNLKLIPENKRMFVRKDRSVVAEVQESENKQNFLEVICEEKQRAEVKGKRHRKTITSR